MSQNVLIVVTSMGELPDGRETGFDWISLAVPYWRLREGGCRIRFASPEGGKPPGDPVTATEADGDRAGAVEMFLGDPHAIAALAGSTALDRVDPDEWQAVLVADGLGALWDVGRSEALAALLASVWAGGGVLAGIGAGVLPLAGLRDAEGRRLVANRSLAVPPDAALSDRLGIDAPALPERALRAAGAQVVLAGTGDSTGEAIEDGRLITAADARAAGDLSLELLGALAIHGTAMQRRAAAEEEAEEEEGTDAEAAADTDTGAASASGGPGDDK